MKKSMIQSYFVLLLSVVLSWSLPAAALAEGKGSSGTTGGADYLLKLERLLPRRLVIMHRLTFSANHSWTPLAGTKKGWGVVPMKEYARFGEFTSVYSLEKFGKEQISPTVMCTFVGKKTRRNALASECFPGSHKPWISHDSFVVDWDDRRMDALEFLEKMGAIRRDALDAADLELPETWAHLLPLDQLFGTVLVVMSPLNDFPLKTLTARFDAAIDAKLADLRALINQVIRADGSCDAEKYAIFVARIQNWKMAKSSYYDEVQAVLGQQPLDREKTLQKIYTFLGEAQYRFQDSCKGMSRLSAPIVPNEKDFD